MISTLHPCYFKNGYSECEEIHLKETGCASFQSVIIDATVDRAWISRMVVVLQKGLACKVVHKVSFSSKNIFIKDLVSINLFYALRITVVKTTVAMILFALVVVL